MLKFIKKAIGLVLEVAGLRVPGATAGQVLVADADGVFTPGAGGGGGSLPAGTNGGVLAHAGGAWASTAAGSANQVLRSNAAAAPTWVTVDAAFVGAVPTSRTITAGTGLSGGGDLTADRTLSVSFGSTASTACVGNDARLSDTRTPITNVAYTWTAAQAVEVSDAGAAGVLTALTLVRSTSATAAPNIGVRILLRTEDAANNVEDAASVDALLTTVTNGGEVGALDVRVRSGGALARVVRFAPDLLRLEWAARALVVRTAGDTADVDVWRVDGTSRWAFGSTDTVNSSGTRVLAPSNGDLSLRRGSTDHLLVNSSGSLTIGTTANTTLLQGTTVSVTPTTSLTIGIAPLCVVDDAAAASITTLLTLRHTTTGTAAAGIGARVALQAEDSANNVEDAVYLDGVLTNAGNGAEASALDVHTRTGGAALRRVARVTAAGGLMLGSAVTQDPGVGGIAIPTTTGIYIESGGTLHNAVGVFGGSNMNFGSGAWTVSIAAFNLSISAGQGTVIANGWLDLSSGFRRRRTAVANTNHTVLHTQSVIDLTGLTAPRTVTGPAAADGIIVTITNSDGSATGANTITFAPATGTVNGAATHVGVNAAYGSCTYWCNGTNWTVIAKV